MSVTIDTECDKSPNWSNSSPLTFNSIYDAIPNKLQPLFEAYSIKPTYFLSPEIIEDQPSVEVGMQASYQEYFLCSGCGGFKATVLSVLCVASWVLVCGNLALLLCCQRDVAF